MLRDRLTRVLSLIILTVSLGTVGRSSAEPVDFAMLPALENPHPTESLLLDITRAGERLIAVGEQGLIIYSDNQGERWQQATVPVSVTLTSVFFSDPEHGWVSGHQGVILVTTDGGQSWSRQLVGRDIQQQILQLAKQREVSLNTELTNANSDEEREELQYQLDDLQLTIEDANKALENGPSEPLLDIWFADNQHGIAVGAYGLLLRTDDGGGQWQLHPDYLNNLDRFHFYSIAALSHSNLLIVGEQGVVWRSHDQGQSWEAMPSPHEGSFFGALTLPNKGLIIFGLRNHVYRSDDFAEHWQPVSTGSESSVLGGSTFGESGVILLTTDGALLISNDNAATFRVKQLDNRASLAAVYPLSKSEVLLVGADGLKKISIQP